MSFLSDRTIQEALPAGVVFPFAGSAAPDGWLLCNGAAVSRTVFARLFASIGTTFGAGDGSITFNLPNTQGIFIRGAGSQTISTISYSGTLGTKGGDQIQGHFHSLTGAVNNTGSTHSHTVFGFSNAAGAGASANYATLTNDGFDNNNKTTSVAGSHTHGDNFAVEAATVQGTNGTPRTGSQTHPANLSMNYIIKI